MSTTKTTATPAAQGGEDQVTGSIITLITNAQVRYEGILLAIDRKERSMHLKEVRSFGSEGRRPELGEIPAHESVQPSVIFKVDHIKDFKIIKRAPEEKQADFTTQQEDPAIVATSNEAPKTQAQHQKGSRQDWNNKEDRKPREPRQQPGKAGVRTGNPNQNLKDQFKDNFNFEGRKLETSEKKEAEDKTDPTSDNSDQEVTGEEETQPKPAMSADSFFDTMSNSTLVEHPMRGRGGRGGDRGGRGGYQGYNSQRGGYQQRGGGENYRGRGDYNPNYRGGYNNRQNDREGGGYQRNNDRGGYHRNNDRDGGEGGEYRGGYNPNYRGGGNRGRGNPSWRKDSETFGDANHEFAFKNDRGGRNQNRGGQGYERGGYQGNNSRGGGNQWEKQNNYQKKNYRGGKEQFGSKSTGRFDHSDKPKDTEQPTD